MNYDLIIGLRIVIISFGFYDFISSFYNTRYISVPIGICSVRLYEMNSFIYLSFNKNNNTMSKACTEKIIALFIT